MPQSARTIKRGWLAIATTLLALALCAWLLAKLIWAILTPVGPLGDAAAITNATPIAQLANSDPFFRQKGQEAGGAVTSLALHLYGTRINQATGLNSAILATPDGVQSSYLVGETIVPGVKLAGVARDYVSLDRGGTTEKLFLDQSVPAPVAAPVQPAVPPALTTPVAPAPPPPPPAPIEQAPRT